MHRRTRRRLALAEAIVFLSLTAISAVGLLF
jgi:hypothetical protein